MVHLETKNSQKWQHRCINHMNDSLCFTTQLIYYRCVSLNNYWNHWPTNSTINYNLNTFTKCTLLSPEFWYILKTYLQVTRKDRINIVMTRILNWNWFLNVKFYAHRHPPTKCMFIWLVCISPWVMDVTMHHKESFTNCLQDQIYIIGEHRIGTTVKVCKKNNLNPNCWRYQERWVFLDN